MTRNWKERHISETGNRSLTFRDQKSWDKRSPEEVSRLEFLRKKQQPWVDWDVDWEKFVLRDDISSADVFEAKKVRYYTDESELEAVVASVDRTESVTHLWETYRLKAVLRSGKTLPYALLKKIGPSSHWKTIQKWIEAEGELPGLSLEILAAVHEVRTQGYVDALDLLLSGEAADRKDRARYVQENRALELVVKILRSWEADKNSGGIRPNAGILERQSDPDYDES